MTRNNRPQPIFDNTNALEHPHPKMDRRLETQAQDRQLADLEVVPFGQAIVLLADPQQFLAVEGLGRPRGVSIGQWLSAVQRLMNPLAPLRRLRRGLLQAASKLPQELLFFLNLTRLELLLDLMLHLQEPFPGFNPRRLVVEIHEGMPLAELVEVGPLIHQLYNQGVRFALDDVTLSHRDLAALRLLPIDWMKLDRALVVRLTQEPAVRSKVATVTRLAHSAGIRVIAEGIERVDELEATRSVGIGFGQGFLFHRPIALSILAAQSGACAVNPVDIQRTSRPA